MTQLPPRATGAVANHGDDNHDMLISDIYLAIIHGDLSSLSLLLANHGSRSHAHNRHDHDLHNEVTSQRSPIDINACVRTQTSGDGAYMSPMYIVITQMPRHHHYQRLSMITRLIDHGAHIDAPLPTRHLCTYGNSNSSDRTKHACIDTSCRHTAATGLLLSVPPPLYSLRDDPMV